MVLQIISFFLLLIIAFCVIDLVRGNHTPFSRKKNSKSIGVDFSKSVYTYYTDYSRVSYTYLISEYAKIREELKRRDKEAPKNTKDSKCYQQ